MNVHLLFALSVLLVGPSAVTNGQPIEVAITEENAPQCEHDNVCITAGCVNAAAHILDRIDPSVDPCDDFYQFSCGTFMKNAIIPDEMADENMVNIINQKIQNQIRAIIAEEPVPTDLNAFKLAKNFYKSCMDEKSIEKRGIQPLIDLTKSYGGWPVIEGNQWNEESWNWYDVYTRMFSEGLDLSLLFELEIAPSFTNSTVNRIYFDDPDDLGMPRQLLKKGSNDPKVQEYYKLMVEIAELFGANRSQAEEELKASLEFEIELAKIDDKKEEYAANNITMKMDFDQSMKDVITIKDAAAAYPYFPWNDFLNTVLPNGIKVDKDEIFVFLTGIFEELEQLLKSTPKRTLANYFMWRTVKYSSDFLTDALQQKITTYESVVTGVKSKMQRWKLCTKATMQSFKMAIDSMWLRTHFKEESKQKAAEIVNRIHREFILTLQNATWIDETTKNYAVAKAEALGIFIGYPEWLLNDTKLEAVYAGLDLQPDNYFSNQLSMNRFESSENFKNLRIPENKTAWAHYDRIAGITSVNAYYAIRHNSVQIPAAFLQDGLFSSEYPNYLNYGVLGWSSGHEITHGYDNTGRQFDDEGNVVNWWMDETYHKFQKKSECFVTQYANYTNADENSEKTSDEDIADNGGVKVAYKAYQKWANEHGAEKLLPGLKYTPQQLFWISNANFWCTARRPEMQELEDLTNEHTAEKFRVIGTVSNMPAFADDFNCPKGSKMNPVEKCEIW